MSVRSMSHSKDQTCRGCNLYLYMFLHLKTELYDLDILMKSIELGIEVIADFSFRLVSSNCNDLVRITDLHSLNMESFEL